MATQIPEPIIDPVSIEINQSIDRLILSLESREESNYLRDRREESETESGLASTNGGAASSNKRICKKTNKAQ